MPRRLPDGPIRRPKSTRLLHSPSITAFTLFIRPWTTSRMCASVMRASSWVSRSNRRSIFSISLSPNNFFANCSAMSLGIVTKQRHGKEALTESTLLDLLLRLSKDGKQFDHYLHDDLRHQRAQRDLGINLKPFEEAPDALKEF